MPALKGHVTAMDCKPAPSDLFFVLVVVLLLNSTAAAAASSSSQEACRSSVYPKLCRTLLSPVIQSRFDSYDYGRFSVKQALKQARKTAVLLDRYLIRVSGAGTRSAGAIEDCRLLTGLNSEYLESVKLALHDGSVDRVEADRLRALMSALVTNQQTCIDGLEASGDFPELYGAFSHDNQLYSVSLELVSSALATIGSGGSHKPNDSGHSHVPDWVGATQTVDGHGRGFPEVDNGGAGRSVTVAKDGSGNFTTIAEAVAFAPNDTSIDDGYFAIMISEGVYNESVFVPRKTRNLIMIGAGINRTVVTGNQSKDDGWSTFNSSIFAVHGERFIAINMTFENTAGPEKHQAVAVRNSADLSSFYRCSFIGYQDTLYVHSFRQFYRDCDIYGTVDFIFGNAAVVLQNCNLYARRPMQGQFNTITAQGRTCPNQTTGISIHNCTIRPAPDLADLDPNSTDGGTTKTFLGRPWKEYSRTVYMQSYIDSFVEPIGWSEWDGSFALSTLYYGEYENYGPGANTSGRVQWPGYSLMNATEAFNFTLYNFTTGGAWLPSTSIPHSGGLI